MAEVLEYKDIKYTSDIRVVNQAKLYLDVYSPKDSHNKEVIIFIHGGSWNSGDKSTYRFLGKQLARKGKIAVIVNYPLAPDYNLEQMAVYNAKAILWVKENIANYGGDGNKLAVMGHSAGAYNLAYLFHNKVFENKFNCENPIKLAILNDPFALDMVWYLSNYKRDLEKSFYPLFGDNEASWKANSLVNFPVKYTSKLMILKGSITYGSIKRGVNDYLVQMKPLNPDLIYHEARWRKHSNMIIQFVWPWNKSLNLVCKAMSKI